MLLLSSPYDEGTRDQWQRSAEERNRTLGHLTQDTPCTSQKGMPVQMPARTHAQRAGWKEPAPGKAGNFGHCQPMHFPTPFLLTVCLYLPYYQRTHLSRALETSRRSPKEDRPKLEMFILFQTTSWFSFAGEHFFGGKKLSKTHLRWHSRQGGAWAPQKSKGLWANFCKQYYVCVICMYGVYVCECTHVPWPTCGGQKTTLGVIPEPTLFWGVISCSPLCTEG